MLSFLLGLVLGLVGGFIGGLFFYAKRVHKNIKTEEVTRATINSIINEQTPKGEFITVNKTEQIIKDHSGDLALGDILEDEDR